MGLLTWLLGKKNNDKEVLVREEQESSQETSWLPISQIASTNIPETATVLYETEMPKFCCIGNLVYERKYQEAIDLGLKLLEQNPEDSGVHVNLMDAYFKGRSLSPDYLGKSTFHAKQAILFGHHTGYAELRLAKNLEKVKYYHQSLQLYNLILENKNFHFSTHGVGNYTDFAKRRATILKKMDKALDSERDVLFTSEEIVQIIQGIVDDDAREKADLIADEIRMQELEKMMFK